MSCTVEQFNSFFINLVEGISIACNKKIVLNNLDILKSIIDNKKETVIDFFSLHVLKYKDKIDKRDDNFFMTHTFEGESEKNNILSKVLEFKELWSELTDENKNTVKDYMILLCNLSQNYVLEVTNNN